MSFDPSKYTKSKWIKGADLTPGQPITGTIKAAYEFTFEQSGETKPALDFYDIDQSMTLNKSQTQAMIDLFGNDPSQWIGQAIQLMAVPSSFQGKPTILITAANANGNGTSVQPMSSVQSSGNGATNLQGDATAEVQFQ